ncbi:MAG: bifunctional hydroxymethylpyrimidine kinase/phosphomethylpyrimidine kinase [Calditrichota bacterium]
MFKALTIAGSDCSGGAGIQADLKTFAAFGVYGMSALTAVVAENTVGVQAVFELPIDIIQEQIKSVVNDIPPDAVKIGMLSRPEVVHAVADAIRSFNLQNVVLDPVLIAKNGCPLTNKTAVHAIKESLLSLATVVTPNLYEVEALLNRRIETIAEMKDAAATLYELGQNWIVIKGGHLSGDKATDVAYNGKEYYLLDSPRINTPNTHGTGCTFSSAIAAGLAKGVDPLSAIRRAKEYIQAAIKNSLNFGRGHGPTNHLVGVQSDW